MGLDVYLERCADLDAALALEEEYERRSDALWDFGGRRYEDLTEEEKDGARAQSEALRAEMGLGEYGRHPAREEIQLDSALRPEHMFKIGYFRSSYNEGGINNVLRHLGMDDLNDIFQPGKEYHIRPDWAACLERTDVLLAELRAYGDGPGGKYQVFCFSHNPLISLDELPGDEAAARDVFLQHLTEWEGRERTSWRSRTLATTTSSGAVRHWGRERNPRWAMT